MRRHPWAELKNILEITQTTVFMHIYIYNVYYWSISGSMDVLIWSPLIFFGAVTWWCCCVFTRLRTCSSCCWSFTNSTHWVFISFCFRNCLHRNFLHSSRFWNIWSRILPRFQLLLIACRRVFVWHQWHRDANCVHSINLGDKNAKNKLDFVRITALFWFHLVRFFVVFGCGRLTLRSTLGGEIWKNNINMQITFLTVTSHQ